MIQAKDRSSKWRWKRWAIFIVFLSGIAMSQTVQAVSNGGYTHPEILIQPQELKVIIDKKDSSLRIIDVREKLQYLSGHIPGAVQVWRPDIEDRMHALPGMMAAQKQLEDLMGGLGIDNKSMIVIYSDGPDNGRLWWVLAYYGFPITQMKLLDGGIGGWKAKGYGVEIVPPKAEKASFNLQKEKKRVRTILCTLSDMKSALKEPERVVLDVRSKKEFLGEEIKKGAARSGRIPGVTWVEWKEVLVEEGSNEGYWKPADEIKKVFSAKGVTPDKDIYIYWHSGVRSAHSLVSLYLVGYPLNKLHNYDGSWIEWSRTQETMETGLPVSGSDRALLK